MAGERRIEWRIPALDGDYAGAILSAIATRGVRDGGASHVSRVDRGFSVLLLAIGVAFFFEAAKLPFWTRSTPGSGMFPTLASLALVAVSGLSLLGSFTARGERPAPSGGFWPRRILFVDSLPKNASGKIQRKIAREPLWAGQARRIH